MLLVAIAFGCWFGCSGQQQGKQDQSADSLSAQQSSPAAYANWKTYTYKTVRIIYPEGHFHEPSMNSIAVGYMRAIERGCEFLGMNQPRDTLAVYYYTGEGQAVEITGHQWPYAERNAIHYWPPSYLGPSLMEWLVQRWQPQKPRLDFVRQGIMTLFDYSGMNYREMVRESVERGALVGLRELDEDTLFDYHSSRIKPAPAATFVDFVRYQYGRDGLWALYSVQTGLDSAVVGLFGITVDSLQQQWIEFVMNPPKADTTKQ